MGTVEVRDISKAFVKRMGRDVQTIHALDRVNLTVREGEFVSIVGPSGCGKTTLLRIIDGLILPDEGEVCINGHVVREPGRDRAMVFQDFGLLPWKTVTENIRFALQMRKIPGDHSEIVRRHVELVGLKGFEHHYPHELSGGMQQRVGIARALTIDPEVLLMDEPFAALDAQMREVLQAELLKIWEQTAKTIIFITHSIDEAVYLSDRVVVLSQRPGQVRETVRVDLPQPRWSYPVRKEPRFWELREYVWELIRESVLVLSAEADGQ